jgi:hypothetical protein
MGCCAATFADFHHSVDLSDISAKTVKIHVTMAECSFSSVKAGNHESIDSQTWNEFVMQTKISHQRLRREL